MKELISVIMPTYNRGYIISIAIESILKQTYKNLELIIIDDCSTDNTEEIISRYNDNRLKYIRLNEKRGSNYARNVGIEESKGDYITFQDSDDYSFPERIEIEYNTLKAENVDLVFSSFYKVQANGNEKEVVDDKDNKIKKKLFPKKKVKTEDVLNVLLYKNIITTQVLFGKKELFMQERFDNDITRFQDWDLMIRIAQKYKVFHIEKPLLYLFMQKDSITKSNKKGYESLEIIYKKYSDYKQKCRILFRIGTFKMLENIDATEDFKEGLSYYRNFEYYLIFIFYRIKIYKYIYTKIKR